MLTNHRKLLAAIALVSFAPSFSHPMLFLLPLSIILFLLRDKIAGKLASWPLSFAYIISGTFIGLLIELFAVLDNMHKPAAERILMSPNPLTDLFYGIFYYSLVVIVWYLLLKRYSFSKKEIFFLTGITLGLFTEQMGAIFLGMFVSVAGLFVAMFVITIYGAFPTLAYMLTEERFSLLPRQHAGFRAYLAAIALLYIQWTVFGLAILPFLKLLV